MLLGNDANRKDSKDNCCAYYDNCVILCECFCFEKWSFNFLSPIAIMEGIKLDYNKRFQVNPGKHTQTFDGLDKSMRERIIIATNTSPMGNR